MWAMAVLPDVSSLPHMLHHSCKNYAAAVTRLFTLSDSPLTTPMHTHKLAPYGRGNLAALPALPTKKQHSVKIFSASANTIPAIQWIGQRVRTQETWVQRPEIFQYFQVVRIGGWAHYPEFLVQVSNVHAAHLNCWRGWGRGLQDCGSRGGPVSVCTGEG